ncbi:MAG: aliphatic sulfonate ABC transporter substrate-binding protein [Clostridium sp.]|uniref:ABC transporter substrate-binding protein n=1 Tax=Clostridium sp. TaxID=1506 RepID=UPI0025BA8431|nr:aliphatic sulfonate ABC transporter substrate-binding protein [Clostridium sp.]MCF0147243.1 aliphatic sulfonate ABC transporter substrate-binding protein [Clostridium sp.]
MKLRNKVLTSIIAGAVIITSMVGCSQKGEAKKSDLSELTITHVTAPLNVPSIVQKNKNMIEEEFKNNGKDITVKYAEITSGADQTQALASGDVDILYALGGTSAVLAAANGADIKVLNIYGRSPEAYTIYSKDASIKSAEDLRGKTVAGPVGTTLHQLLVAYLEKAGMTIEDVNYVNMSIPDAKAALDAGSIDAALVAGATSYKSKEEGYNLIADGKGLTDGVNVVAVREDFYNEHKEEIDLFIKTQSKVLDFINENHDETMEIVANDLGLEKAAVEEMFKQYDFNIEITEADREAMQNVADFMYKTKMIDKEFNTDSLFLN